MHTRHQYLDPVAFIEPKRLRYPPLVLAFLFSAALFHVESVCSDPRLPVTSNGKDIPRLVWFDGNRKRALWRIKNQAALFFDGHDANKKSFSLAEVLKKRGGVSIVSKQESYIRIEFPRDRWEPGLIPKGYPFTGTSITPLFSATPEEEDPPFVATGQFILSFQSDIDTTRARGWGDRHAVTLVAPLGLDHAFLFECEIGSSCIDTSNHLRALPEVKYAYPNWLRPRLPHKFDDDIGHDPLLPDQWHLNNTGQSGGRAGEDIDAFDAWSFALGTPDEVIAVVDDGLETAHADLKANIIDGVSWDFVSGDADPTAGEHGTAVAGIAAARGGNGIGLSGVAPHAGLAGIRVLGKATDTNVAAALTHKYDIIDIYSNSWGPPDTGSLSGPGPLVEAALREGVDNGREGRGAIYVWTGGNGLQVNDNANYDGFSNQPYVIAVSATNSSGRHSFYSEPGANLLLNAPGGGNNGWITTTDRTGAEGFGPGDYISDFGGTSAVAPMVAGVVALMLEANLELSWRDVKQILAQSAEKNDPTDVDWNQNGAGLWVNHKYGYGRVDATAAVTAAFSHINLPPQKTLEAEQSPGLPIPDNTPLGVTSEISIDNDLTVEFVQVMVDSDHPYWGDLEITLTSPGGTGSILAERHNSAGAQLDGGWTFGVARLLGESSKGVWQLTVRDLWASDIGKLKQWRIKVFGHRDVPSVSPPTGIPTLSGWGLALVSILIVGVTGIFRARCLGE